MLIGQILQQVIVNLKQRIIILIFSQKGMINWTKFKSILKKFGRQKICLII